MFAFISFFFVSISKWLLHLARQLPSQMCNTVAHRMPTKKGRPTAIEVWMVEKWNTTFNRFYFKEATKKYLYFMFKDHFLFPLERTPTRLRAMTMAFNEFNDQRMNPSNQISMVWMLYVFRSLNWKYFDWQSRHFLFELCHGSNGIMCTAR